MERRSSTHHPRGGLPCARDRRRHGKYVTYLHALSTNAEGEVPSFARGPTVNHLFLSMDIISAWHVKGAIPRSQLDPERLAKARQQLPLENVAESSGQELMAQLKERRGGVREPAEKKTIWSRWFSGPGKQNLPKMETPRRENRHQETRSTRPDG